MVEPAPALVLVLRDQEDLVAAQENIIRAQVLTLNQAELEIHLQFHPHKGILVELDKLITHLNMVTGEAEEAAALMLLVLMHHHPHLYIQLEDPEELGQLQL